MKIQKKNLSNEHTIFFVRMILKILQKKVHDRMMIKIKKIFLSSNLLKIFYRKCVELNDLQTFLNISLIKDFLIKFSNKILKKNLNFNNFEDLFEKMFRSKGS